jgi:ABC-type polysaccharide/polyol phosphate transport system ATPase subunit
VPARLDNLPAVAADRVSKRFELPREQVHTLKERALHPFRGGQVDVLQALRDVSFQVEPGEFFGIVGRNGSGKSTLLKCLAGIYGTDVGSLHVNGNLSAFIELGVGFNMDLAARDNILLNATLLGLSPREARHRYDAIIDFAELREFTDLKIKNYSTGMLVRLAFAVMIQVDADILLIDEVLAVGDASFQQKCFDEFERIHREGKTVLLVTHDMNSVTRFCQRAMLLERGRVVAIGDPRRSAPSTSSSTSRPTPAPPRPGRPAPRASCRARRPPPASATAAGRSRTPGSSTPTRCARRRFPSSTTPTSPPRSSSTSTWSTRGSR